MDPTFCLGDFDVTVITYRHMMLTSRQTGSPPAMIGPLMIHYKKSFATYLYFSSSLISLRRDLSNIKCFGTDGEEALVDAFRHAFPNSLHLICSIQCSKKCKSQATRFRSSRGSLSRRHLWKNKRKSLQRRTR